jgi:hypothetical protein
MPRTTRTIRADIPNDVWDRLAAEAQSKGVPLGRHLRNLIVTRDTKKYGASPSTGPDAVSRNEKENT